MTCNQGEKNTNGIQLTCIEHSLINESWIGIHIPAKLPQYVYRSTGDEVKHVEWKL